MQIIQKMISHQNHTISHMAIPRFSLLFLIVFHSLLFVCFTSASELTGTVDAPVQTDRSVSAAWIDLPALLKTKSVDLSRLSIRLQPVETGANDPVDDLAVELQQADGGFYQIVWEVPKGSEEFPPGSTRTFQFTIEKKDSPEKDASESREPLKTNLIANGDFSEPLPDRKVFEKLQIIDLPEGGHAVTFQGDETGESVTFYTSRFSVVGGASYEVSYRYKIENAEPHPRYRLTFYSWMNFLDKEGQALWVQAEPPYLNRASVEKTNAEDTGGWKEVNTVIAVPQEAAFASLDVRSASTVDSSVMVTDIRVVPVSFPHAEMQGEKASFASPAPANEVTTHRFDFGPKEGVVFHRFTEVTADALYDKEKGWGFTRLAKPQAFDGYRPDALGRDFIVASNAEFQVDVPNGDYLVWFLIGDAHGSNSVVQKFYFNQFLKVNEQILHQLDPPPSSYIMENHLAHYADFWIPGMDYYDVFVASNFQEKTATVEVRNGKIQVQWKNLPIAGMMIQSAADKEIFEAEITKITQERRRDTRIIEEKNPVSNRLIQPTSEESKRGFVFFQRPSDVSLYPIDDPAPEERISALKAFVTPGQTEPLWFSLHALENKDGVSIKVSDLEQGEHRIPSKDIDIRVARYIFKNENRAKKSPFYRYRIEAVPLDKKDPVPLFKGYNWTWRLDVQTPEDTPAGLYQGTVSVMDADGQSLASLPVTMRVLPFTLEPLPVEQGFYYLPGEPWYSVFWGANIFGKDLKGNADLLKIIEQNERNELGFAKALGLTGLAFNDDLRGDMIYKDGEVRLKPGNRLSFWMELYKEAGFSTMPWYGFSPMGQSNRLSLADDSLKIPYTEQWFNAYRSFAKNVAQLAKENKWPEILFYISDEASSNGGQKGAEIGAQLGESLKSVEGIRTIASMNGPMEKVMVPTVDIAMPNYAFPIDESIFDLMKKSDTEMWIYNCGDQRITQGFWVWRMGVKGRYQWHYRSWTAVPWDDPGGGGLSVYALSYPSPDGPIPTVKSDGVRAGITDHRYMATLEKYIEKRKDDPAYAKQVASAKEFIHFLRDLLPIDPRKFFAGKVDATEAGGHLQREFANNDAITRTRWAVAQCILDLQ